MPLARTGSRSANSACRSSKGDEKFDAKRFAEGLSEGVLNRLVRAQVIKGTMQDKGKKLYQIRIENASPLILNGLALLGTDSDPTEKPKELLGMSVPPRQEPDRSGHRRGRQVARPQEGNQAGRARPERAVIRSETEPARMNQQRSLGPAPCTGVERLRECMSGMKARPAAFFLNGPSPSWIGSIQK